MMRILLILISTFIMSLQDKIYGLLTQRPNFFFLIKNLLEKILTLLIPQIFLSRYFLRLD
jgi:hypothetical protein